MEFVRVHKSALLLACAKRLKVLSKNPCHWFQYDNQTMHTCASITDARSHMEEKLSIVCLWPMHYSINPHVRSTAHTRRQGSIHRSSMRSDCMLVVPLEAHCMAA